MKRRVRDEIPPEILTSLSGREDAWAGAGLAVGGIGAIIFRERAWRTDGEDLFLDSAYRIMKPTVCVPKERFSRGLYIVAKVLSSARSIGMKQILIVEDKATSRELLRTVLEQQGYDVVEAADGEEALQQLQEVMPDLILLDLQLPIRNGYEVLQAIRADARLAALPVIALTASAMQGDREKALAAGFTGYIAKPVGLSQLRDEVDRLLGNKVGRSQPAKGLHP